MRPNGMRPDGMRPNGMRLKGYGSRERGLKECGPTERNPNYLSSRIILDKECHFGLGTHQPDPGLKHAAVNVLEKGSLC